MRRILSLLLVLGLLGGTAAAFAITEGLKLERSPITRTQIKPKLFSPVCGCPKDRASIDFRLRNSDTATVSVVQDSDTIATVARDRYFRAAVDLDWDGRDDAGAVVPDGTYKVRVHLADRRQTITLPNSIEVDTEAPEITVTRVQPRVFSPDHDGRAEYVKIGFAVSEPARPLLYVDGTQVGRGRIERSGGSIDWYGKVAGRAPRAGAYALTLRAEDRAGNVSAPTKPVTVRVQYIAVGRASVRVRPGARFAVRAVTSAKTVRWLLNGQTGEKAPGTLRFRAPRTPGRYRLFLSSVNHAKTVLVVVAQR